MKLAYVDSSCLVAIAFGEQDSDLACALFLEGRLGGLTFVTLDRRQRELAQAVALAV
jgi:hypothetical protein